MLPANPEAFNPGTQTNPSTGQAFQPVEHWAAASTYYDVNFSGLTVNVEPGIKPDR